MKKILLGICSLAFVSCLSAGVALNTPVEVANAETSIFTETKVQISNNGDKMLVVTGITDVSVIYQLGYQVNGQEYVASDGETAEMTTYYEGLTLGGNTKKASDFIAGAQGLLVWEIAYDNTKAYSVRPYAYVGEKQGDVLIAPDKEEPTFGDVKENFNVFTVTFVDEDGTEIDKVNVNYGATVSEITAPAAKDWYEFDGWYLGEEKYDFEQPIEKDIELTAKYVETKTMVYSVANGNLSGIVTPLQNVTLAEKTWEGTTALYYNYQSETDIVDNNFAGVTIDLGNITVSDYASITVSYQTYAAEGGAYIYLDGVQVGSYYGGVQNVDLVALAKAKGIATFSKVELSLQGWNNTTAVYQYQLYLGSVALVVATAES